MKLAVIACPHWDAGRCALGHHGGRPSPGMCLRHRFKECDGAALTGETIAVAPPDTASICLERLSEEWRPDWQARLLAAGTVLGTRLYVPAALYREAMGNRR